MMTRELAPEEWAAFFDAFSRRFRGRHMTIEVAVAADADFRTLADRLPLLGITSEPAAAPTESIQVMLGDSPVQNVVHVIRQPSRVLVAQVSNGEDDRLTIESATGETTRVDFGQTASAAGEAHGHALARTSQAEFASFE